MAESNTSLDYDVIRREIGRMLGWPRDPSQWNDTQKEDADDMIAGGCRIAYYPPDYQWRFLTIGFSFTTAAEKQEYDLPDDFAELVGELTYSQDDQNYGPIQVVTESCIRQRYQVNTLATTGYPLEAAIRYARPTTSKSTRARLVVWPEPDGEYSILGQCVVQPDTVNATKPRPYGGPVFHECLLNAILWQCERKLGENDGTYAKAFVEQMACARRIDQMNMPDTLGYNGDGSDRPLWTRRDLNPGRVYYDSWG